MGKNIITINEIKKDYDAFVGLIKDVSTIEQFIKTENGKDLFGEIIEYKKRKNDCLECGKLKNDYDKYYYFYGYKCLFGILVYIKDNEIIGICFDVWSDEYKDNLFDEENITIDELEDKYNEAVENLIENNKLKQKWESETYSFS